MKHNLLIPIAGKGSRFVEQGYTIPKQLITAQNKQCLDWSLESFKIEDFMENLSFVPEMLDEEMLFYLRSRGLKREEAKKILVEGFINELFDDVENKDLKKKLLLTSKKIIY